MGGPYLMVIGLLKDRMTYFSGLGYLVLYNSILIVPLVVVLWLASGKALLEKIQEWKRENLSGVKLWAGIAMIILGFLIFLI